MYVEMTCGRCESYFQIDSEDEDPVWLMAHRFANGHADCGFMAPSTGDEDLPLKKKIIKPRRSEDSEEA